MYFYRPVKAKISITILLLMITTISNALAGYSFLEACNPGMSSGVATILIEKPVYITRYYNVNLPDGTDTVIGIEGEQYNYMINKNNQYISELAKIAYLTKSKTRICIESPMKVKGIMLAK